MLDIGVPAGRQRAGGVGSPRACGVRSSLRWPFLPLILPSPYGVSGVGVACVVLHPCALIWGGDVSHTVRTISSLDLFMYVNASRSVYAPSCVLLVYHGRVLRNTK